MAQGIPEPPALVYGSIRNVGRFNSRITTGALAWKVTKLANGVEVGSFTLNASLGNILGQFSYVIEIPCESSLPAAPATNASVIILTPATNIYRFDAWVDGEQATFVIPAQNAFVATPQNRGRIARADLTINAPCDDLNNNEICDSWEDYYFGGYIDAKADPDGDGASNLAEFLAGTDPADAYSTFIIVDYRPSPTGGFIVEWNSSDGRSYTLLSTSQLQGTNWITVRSNIVASPPRNTEVDTNFVPSSPGPGRFYRLKLEL